MPSEKILIVYKFDELSEAAKERARQAYRNLGQPDEWWDSVYENAVCAADILGIKIDKCRHGKGPAIYFSGFSCQGDGARFIGSYRYQKGWRSGLLHEFGPGETLNTLLDIGQRLTQAQAPHFYNLVALCTTHGRYQHSGCMSVDVSHEEDRYRDIGDAEGNIRQALREFADWIYTLLSAEDDWLTSDKTVDENIRANDYDFDQFGGSA